jgi:multicomponent Na+:H+ antiporter subunit B
MSPAARRALVLISCGGVLALVLYAIGGLPAFGHYPGPYGTVLNSVAVHHREIPNVITAVNFDYRGLDTLGEEFILFAAVAGIALVLRHDRERITEEPLPAAPGRKPAHRSEAVRALAILGIAVTVAFGTYMAIHPHLTPGGGFQGGTVLSGFVALAFLGLGYPTFTRLVDQRPTELLESLGAGAYALIGIATVVAGAAFLANILPLGGEGQFFSTGTIPVINAAVALEVCAGFILLFLEFARESRHEEPSEE